MSANKKNRSLWGSRSEAQRIYYQRQTIKRLEQENNQLKNDLREQIKLTNEENLQCSQYAIEINHLKEQATKYMEIVQDLREWLELRWEQSQDIWFVKIINKLNELEGGNNES